MLLNTSRRDVNTRIYKRYINNFTVRSGQSSINAFELTTAYG